MKKQILISAKETILKHLKLLFYFEVTTDRSKIWREL